MSRVPRRRIDARVFYADAGGRGVKARTGLRMRGVELVGVVEVVADRWGGRVGAWGTFVEGEGEGGMGDVC